MEFSMTIYWIAAPEPPSIVIEGICDQCQHNDRPDSYRTKAPFVVGSEEQARSYRELKFWFRKHLKDHHYVVELPPEPSFLLPLRPEGISRFEGPGD